MNEELRFIFLLTLQIRGNTMRKTLKTGKSMINVKKRRYLFCSFIKTCYLCTRKTKGAIAQLVEQRTENPCVPGSIPGGTT